MPQLCPAYFNNLIIFGLFTVLLLVYISSYYILPSILKVNLSRKYISKL